MSQLATHIANNYVKATERGETRKAGEGKAG